MLFTDVTAMLLQVDAMVAGAGVASVAAAAEGVALAAAVAAASAAVAAAALVAVAVEALVAVVVEASGVAAAGAKHCRAYLATVELSIQRRTDAAVQ